MHAVVVNVTINDLPTARDELQKTVVPMVSGSPGFVAGYWVSKSADKGTSMVVLDSEGAAQAVADQIRQAPRGAVTIDSVEVGEVVASA